MGIKEWVIFLQAYRDRSFPTVEVGRGRNKKAYLKKGKRPSLDRAAHAYEKEVWAEMEGWLGLDHSSCRSSGLSGP